MPMIDAFIPEHALTPDAEARLLKELTDILIRAEGYDPGSSNAQRISVLHLHRPAAVFVGGEPSKLPRYRIIPFAPEGQYTDESRATVVREITEAVARAENTPFDEIAPRVWVFPTEVPDGQWGAKGIILRLPDIHAMLAGEDRRSEGEERLARRRSEKALGLGIVRATDK
ncbi:tautomerase family protein [Lysobacter niastensis]|uniref:Tautomerase family protein n=1 Tax=Lysobacter niastensis TaxID=380629 RepID=A0ABS0BCL8_9GAMM|nr:tautomerase family protein [Lysobacter niastensis]MBF6025444.1 tautomerase family protein [Lysobacter niastensis]